MASDVPGTPPDPTPGLEHIEWRHRPSLERPVLITAFEGWNDAGDAASTALRHLEDTWDTEPFAAINPEVFYDFTTTRPKVRLGPGGERRIEWPENVFGGARVSAGLHVVTLLGTEPQLRWRTFCDQVIGVAEQLDVRLVLTVGALLSEVPHTRPTPVYGAAYDTDATRRLGLTPSGYEGPTGIVGVLHRAFADAGVPSASLWAAVPTYVPSAPSPKAALALVERAARLLEVEVDTDDLAAETHAYEDQITLLVEADEESRDYVEHLEASYDTESDHEAGGEGEGADRLVAEVERFLREQ